MYYQYDVIMNTSILSLRNRNFIQDVVMVKFLPLPPPLEPPLAPPRPPLPDETKHQLINISHGEHITMVMNRTVIPAIIPLGRGWRTLGSSFTSSIT